MEKKELEGEIRRKCDNYLCSMKNNANVLLSNYTKNRENWKKNRCNVIAYLSIYYPIHCFVNVLYLCIMCYFIVSLVMLMAQWRCNWSRCIMRGSRYWLETGYIQSVVLFPCQEKLQWLAEDLKGFVAEGRKRKRMKKSRCIYIYIFFTIIFQKLD